MLRHRRAVSRDGGRPGTGDGYARGDVDATAVDRRGGAALASRLVASERLALAAAALFLLSMKAFDWFALSVANQAVPDSGGNAFESLDGPDQLLAVAALVAIALPLARAFALVRAREAAAVTGAAGLLAALVVTYVIISPPDVDADMLTSFAGGIDAGLEPRGGAFVALALAAGVVAGSIRTITRAQASALPARGDRLSAPVHAQRVSRSTRWVSMFLARLNLLAGTARFAFPASLKS